ncbi:MAG: DegV family protein [Chloroflexi bacterium]|nr:DegV family protein [Chloroflexota bacterium]MCH8064739.1 DegV family protein [Chloroflexota bacterium]
MSRAGIVTDTTACLPPGLAARYAIEVLTLDLVFEDAVYRDGLTESSREFYETLASSRRPPTTGSPAPGAYAEAILRAGQDAEAVLCITVSRQFSAMHDAAMQGMALAREQAPNLDIRVLDSGAAAMAQGFVALEAARAAQEGAGIEHVIARAEALMPRVQLLVALDTLTYLGRSGRVPRLLIWASSPLQIKPIVVFQRGSYRPIGIVRTMRGATDRLFQALEQRTKAGDLHVCVHHTNAPDSAAALAERVRTSLQPAELLVSEFTQVMGVHTGPGLLGFAFYSDE